MSHIRQIATDERQMVRIIDTWIFPPVMVAVAAPAPVASASTRVVPSGHAARSSGVIFERAAKQLGLPLRAFEYRSEVRRSDHQELGAGDSGFRCRASWRATALGTNPSCAMACSTRARVSDVTGFELLMTCETVAVETPER